MKPTQIVTKLCHKHKITPPTYGRNGEVSISGRTYRAEKKIENEQGQFEINISDLLKYQAFYFLSVASASGRNHPGTSWKILQICSYNKDGKEKN